MSSRRKRRLPSGCAGVAQLVEHRFCKPGAAGSSPASGFSRLSVRATGYPRSMEHPKDVGDRSALAVMLALRGAGYQIAVPFGENTRYDLVADDGVGLHRVQCKTGRLRNGSVRFMTASSYAHHSSPKERSRHYRGQIDCFGVYCPDTGAVFLVPIEHVQTSARAMLRVEPARNGQRKRIRFAADYEIGTVRLPAVTQGLRASSGARGSSA